MAQSTVIQKAEFNPLIRSYVMVMGTLLLLVTVVGIPLILVWWLGLGQYFANKYFSSLQCELTEKHLGFSKGVLVNVEKTIPLENIQDLTFIEGPILKASKLSILKIETAGNSSSTGADMRLMGILDALKFKEKVMDQREKNKTASTPSTSSQNEFTEMIGILKEIRDLLKVNS